MADDTMLQGVLGVSNLSVYVKSYKFLSDLIMELDGKGDDDLLYFLHFDLNVSVLIKNEQNLSLEINFLKPSETSLK